MTDNTTFVLASSSPRRTQLLEEAGYDFESMTPTIDDSEVHMPQDISPIAYAEALAYIKAKSVARLKPGMRILGADTIVVCNDKIEGKPKDAADAAAMLKRVSSQPHSVITGVALLDSDRRRISAAETHVFMRPLSDDDIKEYIASGEWEGKSGSYAIQETADKYIDRIEGSFSNVVGLPVELIGQLMTELDEDCEKRPAHQ